MVNSMKVEIMIYAYIAICVSMILYNIVYVFILRHREKALSSNSLKFEKIFCDEIEIIKVGEGVSEAHKDFLCKKLDRTAGITAFPAGVPGMSPAGGGCGVPQTPQNSPPFPGS